MFINLTVRIACFLTQIERAGYEMTSMKGVTTRLSQTTYDPESCMLTLRKQSFQHVIEHENS